MNAKEFIEKAVEMARKEERENAIRQLNVVLTAVIASDNNKISIGEIIDKFNKLINQ